MSSRYLIFAVSAALVGALAACESPRPSRPADIPSAGSVDHQQRELEGRIDQAFRSGQLTRDEHRALKNRANEIRREERSYMADGNISWSEKHALRSRLESLSREVERQSSDAQRR